MRLKAESKDVRNCRVFSQVVSVLAVFAGGLALAGWALGIKALTSVLPGLATMKPITAACFALVGLSLWLIQLRPGERESPRTKRVQAARLVSSFVGLVGLLTLAEYLFHLNLGIDEALFSKTLLATGINHPGRMSGATAMGFLLLGASELLTTMRRHYLAQSLAILASLNGFVACIGYLLGAHSLYNVAPYSSMALHTAVLFFLLGLGTLAARPEAGVMVVATSENLGGVMVRRVLPGILVLVMFLGWLWWKFVGLYGAEFSIALLVLSEVVAFVGLLWVSAMRLNRLDEERRQAQSQKLMLAAIVESSEDAISSKNLSGTITSWNQGAERLYGYSAAEIVGKPIGTVIPAELQGEEMRFLEEISSGRSVNREETVRKRKDGSLVYVSVVISPVRDREGQIVGASTVAHDITERKQAEATLREYARVVEGLEEMILVVDRNYRYIIANRAFLNFRGMSAEQVIGRSAAEVIGEEIFATQIKEKMDESFLGKVVEYELNYDFPNVGKRDLYVSYFPIEGRTGVDRIACVLQDITQRKRAEEALRKSEERFSKAFRNSPLAVTISTEAEGRYLDVNEAFLQMTGHARNDVIGRTAADLSFWAEPSQRTEMIRQVEEHGRVTRSRTQFKTSVGETREGDLSAELIEIDGQRCLLAITLDVTETLHLEAQFRQAQKMEAVGRLAGGVAHDFNNILGVILGYSDLALPLIAPESPATRHLAQIKKASHRAVGLTRQLLAFSRQQVVFPRILELNEVVQNVTTMLQRLVGEDVIISFRPKTSIGHINADPGQIEQVLMNLVVNARDAMPNGGEIIIETADSQLDENYVSQHPGSHAGEYTVLMVSDTGCGMDEYTKSRIFEPFFTTKDVGRGTGLGLSTVYGIVKQSGGTIFVYSEPGKGTTFKVYFPRAAGKTETVAQSDQEAEFPGGSEAILVVEDDLPLRELAVRILQDAGYHVMEAADAERALEALRASHLGIDLLLTDVVMPGKSGIELMEQAKAVRPNLRALFMSGYSGDLVALRGGAMGEAWYLEKPFTRSSLLKKVRSVLGRDHLPRAG